MKCPRCGQGQDQGQEKVTLQTTEWHLKKGATDNDDDDDDDDDDNDDDMKYKLPNFSCFCC